MSVPNLHKLYGDRYRIGWDPAYDPKGIHRKNRDPHYMLLPCYNGEVWPYDEARLAADTGPKVGRAIIEMGGKLYRHGDDGMTVLFPVRLFEKVAAVMKPRRKRQVSPEQRQRLVENLQRARKVSQSSRQNEARTAC